MPYKTNLINHVNTIHSCLPRFRAEATINFSNFGMDVRARDKSYQFVAQFAYRENGRLHYTPQMTTKARAFNGWLPYFNKRWEAAVDKLAFKQFCSAKGLKTPAYWHSNADGLRDVIIKPRRSSLAIGIRGPFKEVSSTDRACALQDGEFFEQFIPGRIAKAWYWDGKLCCLELREMPSVTGNGISTVRQLADARRAKSFAEPDWDAVASCLEYQGISLDSVLPSAMHAWTDFRYGSSLYPLILENGNVLAQYAGTKVEHQFRAAGDICLQAIPDSIRALTVFSLDAIVDGEDNVSFLEMNCNPSLHPDVYLPMFEGLFGLAEPVGTALEQQFPLAVMPIPYGAERSPPLRLSAVTRLV